MKRTQLLAVMILLACTHMQGMEKQPMYDDMVSDSGTLRADFVMLLPTDSQIEEARRKRLPILAKVPSTETWPSGLVSDTSYYMDVTGCYDGYYPIVNISQSILDCDELEELSEDNEERKEGNMADSQKPFHTTAQRFEHILQIGGIYQDVDYNQLSDQTLQAAITAFIQNHHAQLQNPKAPKIEDVD